MENKENEAIIRTKLKFEKSDRTNLWVGFVSINSENGYMKGVRGNSKCPKKICVVSSEIVSDIQAEVLYDVEMVRMKRKNHVSAGYVVISAVPCQFEASIESCVIHNAVYWAKVKFGNKTIVYSPMDGRIESMRTISGCLEQLRKRKDVKNLPEVIEEFSKTANLVLLNYEGDGYYVDKKNR